ncbi:LppA family lipoprotein [Nocardia alba]|uniref:Putative LppA-like lipoprotein n=1 Tax=Nocardia alba TaxID=225051 RepID=A0A4R1FMU8_9NOCA|nr:LppA family lipoprotein [Nocardia alba]TCJ93558.1 putative LppA-like lipoprotein [Nocardia alba]
MTSEGQVKRNRQILLAVSAVIGSCVLVVVFVVGMWAWATWGEDPYRDDQTSPEETAEAAEVLQQRVSAEERSEQVVEISKALQEAASAVSPATQWTVRDIHEPPRQCVAPFDRTYGHLGRLTYSTSQSPIPEQLWPQYYDRIRALIAPLGLETEFKDHTVRSAKYPEVPAITVIDRADGTRISVYNSAATAYKAAGTTISANIGCHLPANKYSSPIR